MRLTGQEDEDGPPSSRRGRFACGRVGQLCCSYPMLVRCQQRSSLSCLTLDEEREPGDGCCLERGSDHGRSQEPDQPVTSLTEFECLSLLRCLSPNVHPLLLKHYSTPADSSHAYMASRRQEAGE